MANTLRAYTFEVVFKTATIPITGTDSSVVSVPKHIENVAIYIPALEGATTLAVHSMVPRQDLEGASETFMAAYTYDPGDGSMTALAALVGPDRCIVVPASAFPGGAFKFVASGAQTSAARNIVVAFLPK